MAHPSPRSAHRWELPKIPGQGWSNRTQVQGTAPTKEPLQRLQSSPGQNCWWETPVPSVHLLGVLPVLLRRILLEFPENPLGITLFSLNIVIAAVPSSGDGFDALVNNRTPPTGQPRVPARGCDSSGYGGSRGIPQDPLPSRAPAAAPEPSGFRGLTPEEPPAPRSLRRLLHPGSKPSAQEGTKGGPQPQQRPHRG